MFEVVEYQIRLEGLFDRDEIERVIHTGLEDEEACQIASDYTRQVRGVPGAAEYYVRPVR